MKKSNIKKIKKLSKMVCDAKAKAKAVVIEILKEKGIHNFSPEVNRLKYELLGQNGTNVYFETAEYKDGEVIFDCTVEDTWNDMKLGFDDFEQDDLTFFDIVYDIIGIE